MKTPLVVTIIFILIMNFVHANEPVTTVCNPLPQMEKQTVAESDKLVVLWATGDKEVAMNMLLMYTFNSKKFGWWEDITLVVWGPSAKLLSEDKELQEYVKKIMDQGTEVKACKACADNYKVSEKLEELGITVKYMGELTEYLKNGRHILSL